MLQSLVLIACTVLADRDTSGGASAPFQSMFESLSAPNGFRQADFDLMINFPERPPQSISVVDRLLRHPASVDSVVPRLRNDLASSDSAGISNSGALWPWLDIEALKFSPAGSPVSRLRGMGAHLKSFLQPLSARELAFLRAEMPPLFLRRSEDTSLNAIQVEVQRVREETLTDSVMSLVGKLSMPALASASGDLDAVLGLLISELRQKGWRNLAKDLRALKRQGFPVQVGTEGADVFRLREGIVLDPGGDDRYEFPDSARPGIWLLVLDLGGDDEYHARDSMGGAAAFLSVQAIADLGGNDRYIGKDLAFGSALVGYSRLRDASGDDRYEARCASLGFAFQGIGRLEDLSGNDVYSSAFLSQGASSTRGFGILQDLSGNDQYLSRPEFPDDLRYRDHFLSLSQGFSTGFSPGYSGGIGVLWDREGEDLYVADIFGQGSGYWFSLGLLMDDSGSDKFMAHQYAQGAGVHFATGILWDKEGNDFRASKGVSQGCGHDGGFGLLADERGNDRNVATDMSQGAGSANGLGMFWDLSGDDIYEPANPAMALGHGDMRRDRGSLGFFLDQSGKDSYPSGKLNGSIWRVYDGKGKGYGYGRDAE